MKTLNFLKKGSCVLFLLPFWMFFFNFVDWYFPFVTIGMCLLGTAIGLGRFEFKPRMSFGGYGKGVFTQITDFYAIWMMSSLFSMVFLFFRALYIND